MRKNQIAVYSDLGVLKSCLKQTLESLKQILEMDYDIVLINAQQIIHSNWSETTCLLILPGGADIPYTKALNGLGNQKIKSYVESGGSFLGLCAGSYYAGKHLEFDKGTPHEIVGDRELSFFPGTVRGPILADYDSHSSKGARAANITWKDSLGFSVEQSFVIYYDGGGYFVDAWKYPSTKVLATYTDRESLPSIIECQVGAGKAILSGVHVEYDPHLLDSLDEYLKSIIPSLLDENPGRIQLLKYLLNLLNVKTKPQVLSSTDSDSKDNHSYVDLRLAIES